MITRAIRLAGHSVLILSLLLFWQVASLHAGITCGIFGLGCPPKIAAPAASTPVATAAFVPAFEQANGLQTTAIGTLVTPLNDTYFADERTAQILAQKLGAARVEQRPAFQAVFTSGINTGQPAFYRVLVFLPGAILKDNHGELAGVVNMQFEVNAGILADNYRRMPESQFPARTSVFGFPPNTYYLLSLAEQYCWRMLKALSGDV